MSQVIPEDDGIAAGDSASKSGARERRIAVIDNRIDSRDLFMATREIMIAHGVDCYRLRLTSQNKLILTK